MSKPGFPTPSPSESHPSRGEMSVLDLYCGEGGAAAGYMAAGLGVVGVDRGNFRKRYPGAFLCCDVPSIDPRFVALFPFVHASPPCQFVTELNSDKGRHVNLIPATRRLIARANEIRLGRGELPIRHVIENVRAARPHLIDPVSLFGTMFDCHMVTSAGQRFDLSRERLFETNWPLAAAPDPGPRHPIANVFGAHLRVRSGDFRTGKGTGRTVDLPGEERAALARQLMGMPWATMTGMSEAVPPAYTAFIGEQLIQQRRLLVAA